MRRPLAFIITVIAITFSVDYIWEGDGIDETKVLRDILFHAEMKTFTDSMFGYTISYPGFFVPSEDNQSGHYSFSYHGRTDIIIEVTVSDSINDIIQHACVKEYNGNTVIIDGDYYEDESKYSEVKFHAKAIHSVKRWVIYKVIYNVKYKDSVYRIIKMIDNWKL